MFAKGPMPGWSPKKECLKVYPSAVCERMVWPDLGIIAYVIYDKKYSAEDSLRQPICRAATAKQAWEEFWCRLVEEGKIILSRKGKQDG